MAGLRLGLVNAAVGLHVAADAGAVDAAVWVARNSVPVKGCGIAQAHMGMVERGMIWLPRVTIGVSNAQSS